MWIKKEQKHSRLMFVEKNAHTEPAVLDPEKGIDSAS